MDVEKRDLRESYRNFQFLIDSLGRQEEIYALMDADQDEAAMSQEEALRTLRDALRRKDVSFEIKTLYAFCTKEFGGLTSAESAEFSRAIHAELKRKGQPISAAMRRAHKNDWWPHVVDQLLALHARAALPESELRALYKLAVLTDRRAEDVAAAFAAAHPGRDIWYGSWKDSRG
jgi:hypothetical protein